jgi:hypothetical protein
MKWVIYIFLLLSGCGHDLSKQVVSNSKIDTLILVDSESKFYTSEERDTLNVSNFYSEESYILLGEIEVDLVNYDLYTVSRKTEVCDGFHYTSFLLFRNESEEIRYVVLNDDISCFVDVDQNKIVVRNENGELCLEEIEGFADEMVFECVDGLLQR